QNFTVENGVYKGERTHQSTKYKSLGELMWVSITSHEDKIAHLDAHTDETFTYAELQDKAVRCALWLQKQGIKCGDVISVCTSNQPNSIVPCIAAAYVNAIFNPWNEDMDLSTALHVLQLTTPKVIFCSEKSVGVILNAMKEKNCNPMVVVFGNHDSTISLSDILRNCNNAEAANFRYVELDDVKKTACIIHSSGTTGELSNHTMILMKDNGTLDMTNVPTLWFSSLYWISGVILNVKAISQGGTVILYSQFDEDMTCQLIEKYKVAVLFLSSSMINRFVRAGYVKNYSLPSLKVILGGGAIIKPKIQEELRRCLPHVQILQGYGMTEVGGLVTCQLPNHKDGSCGIVAKNVQIKIVNLESRKVLDPNQSGEIWIKCASMMNGYYRNPEATKSTIDEEGWLHTGDIGYIDEDGELFIIDRIKELIKYRGYQISPGEIEGVLISHPAVLEVAVISIPHATDDEHPLAYIIKKPGAKETKQDLIDFVAKNMMDHYKLRAGIIFLDVFPYTGSGKIARKDLKEMTKKLFKRTMVVARCNIRRIRHYRSTSHLSHCKVILLEHIQNLIFTIKDPDISNKMVNESMIFTVENGIYKGQVTYDDMNKYKCFGNVMWHSIRRNGEKIAHLDACTEKSVTYAELQDKVVRCALWLQKQGIKSDDVISVCTGNHYNAIVPCLSAAYINVIFNPWDENMNLKTALYVLRMMMPKIIFCSEKSIDVILSAIKEQNCSPVIVVFGEHVDAISFSDILKLSNSVLLHISQNKSVNSVDMVLLWFSSLYWISGLFLNLITIEQGGKVIIYPEFNEEMTCRLIEKYQIEVIFLSTSLLSRFLKSSCIKKYPLSSLKVILYGGAVMNKKVQEELKYISNIQILQGYGMTETGGPVTSPQSHDKNGSNGVVAKNVQIKIVDPESGKIFESNQPGEILIKSATIMTGYYNNPEATKSIIDEEGWLHSGDIGYIDEDGELFIIDRIKELIKYKGQQISPAEIENTLISHPAVLEVAIIGVPHALDNEHPLAYVIKKPGIEVTEQELIDFVAENMEDRCKLRAGVIFLDSFPYTGSGKISRKDLKEMTKKLVNYDD
ncbi:4CLL7 protein, partial [Acromyrmex insinuator]